MKHPVWVRVQEELGHAPLFEGVIGGAAPLLVQRYLFQSGERTVSPPGIVALVTHFGGGRVREGEADHWRSEYVPAQSLLIPAHVATHWHYSGTVDFAVFYFLDAEAAALQPLIKLAESRDEPLPFSDPLVGAAAMQLASEIQKGFSVDAGFMERLAAVMLEQAYRVLTTPGSLHISPRHAHFSRLQAVLNHIHQHLQEALPTDELARRAQVSQAHFRRLFEEAVGVAPHRYIVGLRLAKARQLLAMSSWPIARIALECGFSSQSHLTAAFRAAHAITPADYRAALARRGAAPGAPTRASQAT